MAFQESSSSLSTAISITTMPPSPVVSSTLFQPSRVSDVSSIQDGASGRLSFLDLPPEIRNMIYEELLVVGRVRYLSKDDFIPSNYRKPQLALLSVCKQIHDEAEPLYLSKNLFMFPKEWYVHEPFCGIFGRSPLFSGASFEHVKSISLTFDNDQIVPKEAQDRWYEYELEHGFGSYMQLTEMERRAHVHNCQIAEMEDAWNEMQDGLCEFESLEYVEADYSNMYCPGGCCRALHVCNSFWVDNLRLQTIDVSGLLVGEQSSFCSHLEFDVQSEEEMEAEYGLHFMRPGEKTKWDAYADDGRGFGRGCGMMIRRSRYG